MTLKLYIALAATAIALYSLHLAFRPTAIDRGLAVAVRPAVPALYLEDGKYALDDELLYGMVCRILAGPDKDHRVLVATRYRNRALVDLDDLLADSAAAGAWERAADHRVAAPFADVQAEAGLTAHPPILTLPRGAAVPVLGEEGEYCKVGLVGGGAGFVRKQAIRKARTWGEVDEAAGRARVAEDALSYLGCPYRWGGKSPAGLDCSGLASMAYLLNGLAIHRNSRPLAGFPVAMLQLPAPPAGHTRQSLARAGQGDLIYWRGHQAVYLGDGKYLHANATGYRVEINSLLGGDEGYRPELANPAAILAWGTAYPERPDSLRVHSLAALPDGTRAYRFYARLEGFAPTRAVLYPEGAGEGKPALAIDNPGAMLFSDPETESEKLPRHQYPAPGAYRPAVLFVNDGGWRPDAKTIESGLFVMPEPLVVK